MNPLTNHLLQQLATALGNSITRYEQVPGGDINQTYKLHSAGKNYFLKLNNASSFPGMFAAEAEGLHFLRHHSMLRIPQVLVYGATEDTQWLLLEWIEKGAVAKTSMERFGQRLAEMHQQPQAYFGWTGNNYIGSLRQTNTAHEDWMSFFTACRLQPLITHLLDTGAAVGITSKTVDRFFQNIQDMFPKETPSLLHGDLWSGNFMIDATGTAAIFDPAVYFGHREMDLGMTRLFGGFNENFYKGYNSIYPLEKGWEERLPLSQLYPLLVHAVLFGGHYIAQVQSTIMRYA
ncbi:MAG TPA: fructosamine kinase family protein [Chitinophagaceae bacterium]|nr:fructosamine kinase family protein [Chitinophagaceae bacterium]